ncbi:hypothetical protein niasHS_018088 [Heterodera schachtii]|uniref:Ubiquitin-like domain-containing protein n=1 Tax=Heterodera schachtii TaxID=97005 RepID=A0ABD2I884_HETSC
MLQFGVSQLSIVIMLTLMMLSFADCMKIKVKYDSKKFPVVVDEKDTVATLKTKIREIKQIGNIPIQKQILFNEITGSVFGDKKTMDEYGIGEGDTIYLEVVSDIYFFPIDVSYGSRQTIVWVKCTDTVKDLKKKIANFDKLGNIPIQKQTLTKKITWNSWIDLTDDEKTINKYGIGEGQNVLVSWDEFEFFVEYKEKMYPIKVNAMTTLKEVKEKMAEITGIPTEKQTLSHYKYGQWNDNGRVIDFVKEDMPFLIMSDGSGITVQWQNHFWEFFVVNVNGTDTVATVKQKIRAINKGRHNSELSGVIKLSKCDFNCEFAKALADEKTMDEYGIGEGITIYMTIESSTIMLCVGKKAHHRPHLLLLPMCLIFIFTWNTVAVVKPFG